MSSKTRGTPLSMIVNPGILPALDEWADTVGANRSGVARKFFEIGLAKAASENPQIAAVFGDFLAHVKPKGRNGPRAKRHLDAAA